MSGPKDNIDAKITFLKSSDERWSASVGEKQLRSDSVLGLAVYHCLEEVDKINLLNASQLIADKLEARAGASASRIETTVAEMEQLAIR